MRWWTALVLSSGWFLLSIPLPAAAAEAPPLKLHLELSLHQESTPTTVGDRVRVELVLSVGANSSLPLHEAHFPEWGSHWGETEVVSISEMRTARAGSRTRFSQQVELMASAPGEVVLPAISVRVRTESGELRAVSSKPLAFVVHSVLPAQGATPPPWPSAPPRELPLPATFLPTLAILASAVLVLLGLLAWQARRRRNKARPTAIEELRRALDNLRGASDGVPQLHTALSLAWRRYLHRRLARPALESTCTEIESWLHGCPISPVSAGEVVALLRRCDSVRFAAANSAHQPSPANALLMKGQRLAERIEGQLLHIGWSPGTGDLEHDP